MDDQSYQKLSEEIEELKEHTGKQRGEPIKYFVKYVKEKEGEEKFAELEKLLKKMGVDISNVGDLTNTELIPEHVPQAFIVAAARLFNWTEEDVFEMARSAVPLSLHLKVFIKYFASIEKGVKATGKFWRREYTRGYLEAEKFKKKGKHGEIVLSLNDFKNHPLIYAFIRGFISHEVQLITGADKVEVKGERKPDKGKERYKIYVKW